MPFIGPKPADTVLDSTLIADGSITSAKIADGAIVNADLNNSAAIATSKITGLAASATTDTTNAANIASGTIADARISASSVQQHATSFDDNKLVNDISTLAIRQASNENKGAYNTNSMYVDVFQDDTGIASNTNAPRNSLEYVSSNAQVIGSNAFESESSDRRSTYTLTDTFDTGLGLYSLSGALSKMIDGSPGAHAGGGSDQYLHGNGHTANKETHYMRFDRGSGNEVVFTGFQWRNQNNSIQYGGTDAWLIQGSNDNTNWTDLHNFTWTHNASDVATNVTFSNTTAYRSIQITPSSSLTTSYGTWQRVYTWGISPTSGSFNATGNFISNVITAPSSTSKMGAIITYQDHAGTNTLNTDIVLQLSADNGSNFTTATLTALPDFSTGIKMAKVNDLSVTAGTQLKYKISFANQASGSKEARIRGVSLQY